MEVLQPMSHHWATLGTTVKEKGVLGTSRYLQNAKLTSSRRCSTSVERWLLVLVPSFFMSNLCSIG